MRNEIKLLILSMIVFLGSNCNAEENNDLKTIFFKPTAYFIEDIQEDGRKLILNDGSVWDIKDFGGKWKIVGWGWNKQQQIAHWGHAPVELQVSSDNGNWFEFVLVVVNLLNGETAYIALSKAPSIDHPACLWIADYDKNTQYLKLSDGSTWLKTDLDVYGTFFNKKPSPKAEWKIGDPVTLIAPINDTVQPESSLLLWNHATNQMPYIDTNIKGSCFLWTGRYRPGD